MGWLLLWGFLGKSLGLNSLLWVGLKAIFAQF
jgi:hypothetical protein